MQFKTILLSVIPLVLFSTMANAGIYKCKQGDGSIKYVDKPCSVGDKTERIKTLNQPKSDSSTAASSSHNSDVPFFSGATVIGDDEMESGTKGKFIRDIEYKVNAEPKDVLAFYRDNPAIKACEKNDTADNHICKLAKYKSISGGDIFVDDKKKKGTARVYMSYFYKK